MQEIEPSAIVGFELTSFGKYVCRKTECVGRIRGPEWRRVIHASQALDGKSCTFCRGLLVPDHVKLIKGVA